MPLHEIGSSRTALFWTCSVCHGHMALPDTIYISAALKLTDFPSHMLMQGLRISGTIPDQGPLGGEGRPLAAPVTSLTPVGRSPPRTASQLPAPN